GGPLSFPTRRSSDLARQPVRTGRHGVRAPDRHSGACIEAALGVEAGPRLPASRGLRISGAGWWVNRPRATQFRRAPERGRRRRRRALRPASRDRDGAARRGFKGRGDDVRQHVLKQLVSTAAAARLLGWMWLAPAVGMWAMLAAELRPEPEPMVLVVPAPQIVTAQVAAAEVQVATVSWYGPGFYG